MSVFKNFRTYDKPTPKHFLRQANPNVTPYDWIPQRQRFALVQPNEKGSFFPKHTETVEDGTDNAAK